MRTAFQPVFAGALAAMLAFAAPASAQQKVKIGFITTLSGPQGIIGEHMKNSVELALVTHHTLFREETRWPGYYYRGDHMKLDDKNWHCFTLSRYDRDTGKWAMEKAPVYHIIN